MSNFCTIDIETGIKEIYCRKAHFLYNPIIAACFKHQNEDSKVYYKEDDWNKVLEIELSKTKTMIAFNAKFECLYFWKYPAFQRWLADGGRIFDPQMAHYMLRGQRERYPKLRTIAEQDYGCPYREKHIDNLLLNKLAKKLSKKKITLEEHINKVLPLYTDLTYNDILSYQDMVDLPEKYVSLDVKDDVIDTEAILLRQISLMKKEGMFVLGNELMEGILATSEMEYNGVFTDEKLRKSNQALLELEIIELKKQVVELGSKYCHFDPSSSVQVSRLFFGGSVKTKEDVPILNELGQLIITKSGPNRGQVKTRKQEVIKHELGMRLIPDEKWKGARGIYSTDDLVLKVILHGENKEAAKIAKIMLVIREKEKMYNTYYVGFDKYVHEDGLIRGNLNHCVTVTGRTSSDAPNLQNISN